MSDVRRLADRVARPLPRRLWDCRHLEATEADELSPINADDSYRLELRTPIDHHIIIMVWQLVLHETCDGMPPQTPSPVSSAPPSSSYALVDASLGYPNKKLRDPLAKFMFSSAR